MAGGTTFDTRPNLRNGKFEQLSTDVLTLSGTTNFLTTLGGSPQIDGTSILDLLSSGTSASNGLTKVGNKIVFGGELTGATKLTTTIVSNPLDETFIAGTGVDFCVGAIEFQYEAQILVAGCFTNYDSYPASSIVRVNSDGSPDGSFESGTGFNAGIYTLSVQPDNKVIAGGAFSEYSGVTSNSLIRLNANGSVDDTFDIGSGFNNSVFATAVQSDEKILVGGQFTQYKPNTYNHAAKLSSVGSVDVGFNIGTGFDTSIFASLLQSDNKIVSIGDFTTVDGNVSNRIARLNVDGSFDDTFVTGDGFNDAALAGAIQSDGKILVGGQFTSYSGQTANYIVRLNADGTKDDTFVNGVGFDNNILAITIQSDDKILVGGMFTTYSGVTSNRIIRLNPDGSIDDTFVTGTGFSNGVYCIVIQPDDKILVSGYFNEYDSQSSPWFIRLNTDGSVDTTFAGGGGFDYFPASMVVQSDNKIVLGGQFTSYSGVSAFYVIRLNSDGTIDDTYDTGDGFNSVVEEVIIQPDDKVIFVGQFSIYGDFNSANRIVRLNTDGSVDETFDHVGPYNDVIWSIVQLSGGSVFVGGTFTFSAGPATNYIIRLNSDGSADNTFVIGNGFDQNVADIAIQDDDKILIVGNFTTYSGASANGIIRLNTDGSIDDSFVIGSGFLGGAYCLTIQPDGKILVGGYFASYNGVSVEYIVRLNSNGTIDTSFVYGSFFNNGVSTIALFPDGKIVVGGYFTMYSGVTANRMIKLTSGGTISEVYGDGFNNAVQVLKVQGDEKILAGGDFTSYNGEPASRIARIDLTLTTNPTIVEFSSNGLKYGADFTPILTSKSLVDKDYVDNAGSAVNGLNKSTGGIGLGGNLTGNTLVNLGSFNISFLGYGGFSHGAGGATGAASFASGFANASGPVSSAFGYGTCAVGFGSHAQGCITVACGDGSHAEGCSTLACGQSSHAEGVYTCSYGQGSHAEGYYTVSQGSFSHSEGKCTCACGDYSHSEGVYSKACGYASHSEGASSAYGCNSHSEGTSKAFGDGSHAEGSGNACGEYSHAEGFSTQACGVYSHAEGFSTEAAGEISHAEGGYTFACGACSHSEGERTYAAGDTSHSEGRYTCAYGFASHAGGSGYNSPNFIAACGNYSFNHSRNDINQIAGHGANATSSAILGGINHHISFEATGATIIGGNSIKLTGATYRDTTAVSKFAIMQTPDAGEEGMMFLVRDPATGMVKEMSGGGGGTGSTFAANGLTKLSNTIVLGGILTGNTVIDTDNNFGVAVGKNTVATGNDSFATGYGSQATGSSANAFGYYTYAFGCGSFASGYLSKAFGCYSNAANRNTRAIGHSSHAEGSATCAIGYVSHSEGFLTCAIGNYSHAEGRSTCATGASSHAQGRNTKAIGDNSHAEGYNTCAIGYHSHAEGNATLATGFTAHAEGFGTRALNNATHAEGKDTWAIGYSSHAEGFGSCSIGTTSHAEGGVTKSIGISSHAEGTGTIAYGGYSHAEGNNTFAYGVASHAEGGSTCANGDYSHSGGHGSGGYVAKEIKAVGFASFNHSINTASQISGHGALASGSTILGGSNHHIASGNTRAAIIGGDAIKLTGSTYADTTVVSKFAIMSTPAVGTSGMSYLVRDSATGIIKTVTGATGGGGSPVTANNGLTKSGNNIHLGGVLTGNTTIVGGGNSLCGSGLQDFVMSGNFACITAPGLGVTRRIEVAAGDWDNQNSGYTSMRVSSCATNQVFNVSQQSHNNNYAGSMQMRVCENSSCACISYDNVNLNGGRTARNVLTLAESACAGSRLWVWTGNTGVYTDLRISVTGTTMRSTIPNFKGLRYGADYSSNFDIRSVVDKGYVDNLVGFVSVVVSGNTTLAANVDFAYVVTSGGSYTVTLPASPTNNQQITVKDATGNAATNSITIAGNGNTIDGGSSVSINTAYGAFVMTYSLVLDRWLVTAFVN